MNRTDSKAFEILVRENSRMLTTYLRTLVRDESAVDDLFQETMVVAWEKLDECDLSRPFGPWLRAIASRLVMAHYRKQKRIPVVLHEGILAALDRQFESINSRVGDTWDEKIAALQHCVETLPDLHRRAVEHRYFDQTPARDVAQRLGISLEACKKRLQRARALLAECLKRKHVLGAEVAS